jgi:hypothetical protein
MMEKDKLIAIAIITLLSLGVFAALGRAEWGRESYTAEVNLAGSMHLRWYHETNNVTIATNFTANVPMGIIPGQYNATFDGFASVDATSVEFEGMISTENGTHTEEWQGPHFIMGFMVEFSVPNEWPSIPTGKSEASGELNLTLSNTTLPPIQFEWIHVMGPVTQYGNTTVHGWLNAHAKIAYDDTSKNMTKADVFWAPMPAIDEENPTGNFSYSFYRARLINATTTALNYSGNDFYASGLWSVYNITFVYGSQGEESQEDALIVKQNATGELKVYGNWTSFTVSITGFDDVKGSVKCFTTHDKTILEGDFFGRGHVDIYDLVHVAKHIGDTPRNGSDLQNVESSDVNGDSHIDVYDLVTVANEIGQTG